MTTYLYDWERDIMPWCSGVPRPSLERAVLQAVQQFCDETWLYNQELTAIDIDEDDRDYTLSPPASTKFVRILTVKYKEDGEDNDKFARLREMSVEEWQWFQYGGWKYQESDVPVYYWVDEAFILYLYPIPTADSTGGLLVEAALRPADDATTVPDFLLNNWRQAIKYGALAYLLSQKAQSWYDPQLALQMESRLRREIGNAKWDKIRGKTQLEPRVIIPFFA